MLAYEEVNRYSWEELYSIKELQLASLETIKIK
jgi:hypothetical protein